MSRTINSFRFRLWFEVDTHTFIKTVPNRCRHVDRSYTNKKGEFFSKETGVLIRILSRYVYAGSSFPGLALLPVTKWFTRLLVISPHKRRSARAGWPGPLIGNCPHPWPLIGQETLLAHCVVSRRRRRRTVPRVGFVYLASDLCRTHSK